MPKESIPLKVWISIRSAQTAMEAVPSSHPTWKTKPGMRAQNRAKEQASFWKYTRISLQNDLLGLLHRAFRPHSLSLNSCFCSSLFLWFPLALFPLLSMESCSVFPPVMFQVLCYFLIKNQNCHASGALKEGSPFGKQ